MLKKPSGKKTKEPLRPSVFLETSGIFSCILWTDWIAALLLEFACDAGPG